MPHATDLQDVTLHPMRLAVRNALLSFIDLCLSYRTQHRERDLNRTRELTAALGDLKREVEARGPLSMPELNESYAAIIAHAWSFQRLLDRQRSPDARPIDANYDSVEDNIYNIEDWFAEARGRIITLFESCLAL